MKKLWPLRPFRLHHIHLLFASEHCKFHESARQALPKILNGRLRLKMTVHSLRLWRHALDHHFKGRIQIKMDCRTHGNT